MSFTEAIQSVFSKYGTFSGRARRSEYWYFFLFNILASCVLSFLGTHISIFKVLASVYSLAVFVPSLAVGWRRMHDIGKSGAWYLLGMVPLIGTIIVLVWACRDSDPGANEFGPNPKGEGEDLVVYQDGDGPSL